MYRAWDGRKGRSVALKLLSESPSAESIARRSREEEALRRLHHPRVPALLKAGEEAGRLFLSLAYVEGRPLREVLDEGRVEPTRAVAWARDLAEILAHCHEQGVVHRDLKPANVLVDTEDRVHLVDFGIAVVAGQDHVGPRAGTPRYMAPEQRGGKTVSAATDAYQLGLLLFECLRGRPAFSRKGPPRGSAPAAVELGEDLPPELAEAVAHLTAPSPSARPRDLQAFAEGLPRPAALLRASRGTAPALRPSAAVAEASPRRAISRAGEDEADLPSVPRAVGVTGAAGWLAGAAGGFLVAGQLPQGYKVLQLALAVCAPGFAIPGWSWYSFDPALGDVLVACALLGVPLWMAAGLFSERALAGRLHRGVERLLFDVVDRAEARLAVRLALLPLAGAILPPVLLAELVRLALGSGPRPGRGHLLAAGLAWGVFLGMAAQLGGIVLFGASLIVCFMLFAAAPLVAQGALRGAGALLEPEVAGPLALELAAPGAGHVHRGAPEVPARVALAVFVLAAGATWLPPLYPVLVLGAPFLLVLQAGLIVSSGLEALRARRVEQAEFQRMLEEPPEVAVRCKAGMGILAARLVREIRRGGWQAPAPRPGRIPLEGEAVAKWVAEVPELEECARAGRLRLLPSGPRLHLFCDRHDLCPTPLPTQVDREASTAGGDSTTGLAAETLVVPE